MSVQTTNASIASLRRPAYYIGFAVGPTASSPRRRSTSRSAVRPVEHRTERIHDRP
ncbi:MAG TPA: hypothetical protein VFH76_17850 [Kribbella sp.]|nr:hypothetical protein [Kribbella sp.]